MIAELSERGFSDVDIAKKMNWRKRGREKVAQALRILGIIDEIRGLNPGQVPYSKFDAKKEHLINLDTEYQSVQMSDPKAAYELKWNRILAIFLGATKDQIRVIDEDFMKTHVIHRVTSDSQDLLAKSVTSAKDSETDDLSGLLDDDEDIEDETTQINPKNLVSQMLNIQATTQELDGGSPMEDNFQDIAEAVRLGAMAIITENNFKSMLTEPADVLRETRLNLEKILSGYSELTETKGFDSSKFGYELKKVSKVVSDLEAKYK
jgi:hypothetical protein